MTVQIQETHDGRILEIHATGKLTQEDYERFVPRLEQLIQQFGKVSMLFDMHDFHGWELGAIWEDIKFDFKHFRDVERLALVGEKKWHQAMAAFCRPFTTAKIRYFDRGAVEDARRWVQEQFREEAAHTR